MLASDPTSYRSKLTTTCPSCGASGPSCDSVRWLRGRRCCEPCTGTHELPDERIPAESARTRAPGAEETKATMPREGRATSWGAR